MIIYPGDLDQKSSLTCDVCIIGSGAAGIALARELGQRRIDTVCISGGSKKPQTADHDLYRGHIPVPGSHEPLEEFRARTFGGSTTLWGGRLVPFDAIDFEERDFVPMSGWPIRYEEVVQYFPRAAALCESHLPEFEIDVPMDAADLPANLRHGIVTNRCERWSMPTDFSKRYETELANNASIRVLMDQHCTDIELDSSHARVKCIQVRSRGRGTLRIYANRFVLACGGLENARLLLASRRQMPRGIGNQYGMVGRCYMGHISGTHGYLRLHSRRLPAFYRLMRDENGMYLRRRFWLTEEAQRRRQLMNIIAFPFRPLSDDPQHGDPALSILSLAEILSDGATPTSWSKLAVHGGNVMFSGPLAWATIVRQLWARLKGSPRLPFLLPYHRRNQDAIYFQSEHAPNWNSRLVLSDWVDEFGMPRLEPRVAFSEIDTTTILQFYATLDRSLREMRLGHVEYTEAELRDYLACIMQNYRSQAHHLGTTRMSEDPCDGVVDSNCRVHDLDHFYIAGSSVFSTAGHANPTLTILALTLRLAYCLAVATSNYRFCAAIA
jgi:choline dehydrogenase-like flavoprotein